MPGFAGYRPSSNYDFLKKQRRIGGSKKRPVAWVDTSSLLFAKRTFLLSPKTTVVVGHGHVPMPSHPYSDLPPLAFWKTGVLEADTSALAGIYKKKFDISASTQIATAGSCFAQHITRELGRKGFNILDVEPPPYDLDLKLYQKYGYSLYSARYGNIYTARQLLQLAQEAAGLRFPTDIVWKREGRYFDGLRPMVQPGGYAALEEVVESRRIHISKVKRLFETFDLFIFTLGLTEAWVDVAGTVYPVAPGVVAGGYLPNKHRLKSFQFGEVLKDFNEFQMVLRKLRQGRPFDILLTVSPVPLTATATGQHVLSANTNSKAILRAVAGQLSSNQKHIGYFPSYELVTNPRRQSKAFSANLRNVRLDVVKNVIEHFLEEHPPSLISTKTDTAIEYGDVCEEALLDAFAPTAEVGGESTAHRETYIEVIGSSHLAGFAQAIRQSNDQDASDYVFVPNHWLSRKFRVQSRDLKRPVSTAEVESTYRPRVVLRSGHRRRGLIFVGMGMMGEGIIQCFGPLRAGFLDDDGLMSPGPSISPSIPIIVSKEECDAEVLQQFRNQIFANKTLIDAAKATRSLEFFCWVASPMMSERCARFRFGHDYVESKSQCYYNAIYLDFLHEILGDEIRSGLISFQEPSTLGEFGFTKDEFRADEPLYGIHVGPGAFAKISVLEMADGVGI